MCSESDASVMRVDAVLGKVFAFCRLRVVSSSLCCGLTNWGSTAPLLPDRHLFWHHCQSYLVYIFVLARCSSGELTLMASLGSRYDLEDRQF